MASVTVKFVPSPTAEQDILSMPQVKNAVSAEAGAIASRASGMATEKSGIWHEVGKPHNPDKSGGTWNGRPGTQTIGGKEPVYSSKPARMIGGKPFAIAYTGNYAAQKDNLRNNTLLKAKG